jgi:hypothetical protein
MGSNRIETNRQHERNILIRAPDSKQTQNLDFASREVVRKSDAPVPGVISSGCKTTGDPCILKAG